jgi:hypothetical protein
MLLRNLKIYGTIAPVVLLGCVLSLLSGEDWLLWRVNLLFGFHLGTIISWIGLVACSLISIRLNKNYRIFRIVSSISFYISIFWILLSFLLAGNNNLIFTNQTHCAFIIWIIISCFPLLIFLIGIINYVVFQIVKYWEKAQ